MALSTAARTYLREIHGCDSIKDIDKGTLEVIFENAAISQAHGVADEDLEIKREYLKMQKAA